MPVTIAVLVVGLALSVAGAFALRSHVQSQAHADFEERAAVAAGAVSSELRRDADFVAVQRVAATSFPSVSSRQLATWFTSIGVEQRFPGTVGFAAYQRVPASTLPAFVAAVRADPPVDGPFPAQYSVSPPGDRPFYCLQRVGYTKSPGRVPPINFDLCAPELPGYGPNPNAALLAEATDTGRNTILSGPQFQSLGGPANVFAIFSPVYAGGAVPATVDARRSAVIAWVVGTFNSTQLTDTAVGRRSALATSVRFHQPAGGSVPVASAGTVPPGPVFTQASVVTADGLWTVRVTGSAATAADQQALVFGGLGVVVSVLLLLLFSTMARSRARALRLVDERTGQLRHQALHDPLTDLPNRALVLDRAGQMLERARRRPLSTGALFVDIDNFKDINDSFGHEAGDDLLRAVAGRLTGALRVSDSVGRLGGDEFVVLTEGEVAEGGPELVARRIMGVLEEPFRLERPERVELVVNASIGVAEGPRAGADELLHDADVALYEAKSQGKNRAVVFRPEMQEAVIRRMGLEIDLRGALDAGDLHLLYQPTVALADGTVAGVEALLRWHHRERGVLLPSEFVPIAEETGLIVPIGRFVLEAACAEAAGWRGRGRPAGISVNVAGRQLEDAGFVDGVRDVLERNGLEPPSLMLEVDETVLARDADLVARRLPQLKALGVRVAVDSFGTGYSSLASLRRLPVDLLKIDRSFVAEADEAAEPRALIGAMVQLGRSLAVETLAAGVETETQLDEVRRAGCDLGQGFLFARPLEAPDVAAFLAGRAVRPRWDDRRRAG